MPQKTINISLDRDLWNNLSKLAHKQSIIKGKRFPTIEVLRDAIKVFVRLNHKEINAVLKRKYPVVVKNTRNTG